MNQANLYALGGGPRPPLFPPTIHPHQVYAFHPLQQPQSLPVHLHQLHFEGFNQLVNYRQQQQQPPVRRPGMHQHPLPVNNGLNGYSQKRIGPTPAVSPDWRERNGNHDITVKMAAIPQPKVAGNEDSQGGLLIYIDNSNIWINTMEKSAKSLGFRENIKHDQRTRLNISKLLTLASNGRPIIRTVLYGSEPPPVAKFWNNVKECRSFQVDVQVTRRSTYSNREREVDQNIMLDIGEDIVIHQTSAKYGGAVIMFTGDGGMISAVRRALAYNWNVEVWAYRNSLAREYQEEAQNNPKLVIKYLDDCFEETVFHTLEWKIPIPRERSLVLTFRKIPETFKAATLETCVKAFTELVRMPMAGRYLRDNEGDRSKSTHLTIVCCVGKLILKEDVRSDFYYKFETDQNQNSNYPKKEAPAFRFSRAQWDRVPDIFDLSLMRDAPDFFTTIKTDVEALVQEAIKTSARIFDDPKIDFNAEVYHRVEDAVCLEFPLRSIEKSNISEELKTEMALIIRRYKPTIRSLPLFLQDLKIEEGQIDLEPIEAPANEDDGEGGYTVHTIRKPKPRYQKYSDLCKYSFRCIKGFKCSYNHTEKEKEFFKVQPNAELRKTYKRKDCDHYRNPAGECKYKIKMSYLCPFAHGFWCPVCKVDDDGGHNQRTCSAPKQLMNPLCHNNIEP